jgi:diguanylate cyclase (GGDEF)-like protein/PAS domain S-box-containing protein
LDEEKTPGPADTVAAARDGQDEPATLMDTFFASVREGLIVYDHELRYRVWNRYMEDLSGRTAPEVLGRRAVEVFPHLHEQGVDRLLLRALAGETVEVRDVSYVHPATGAVKWYTGTYAPHRDGRGRVLGVVACIHETTERRRIEERLLHDALHDPLTGLSNRAFFVDRLRLALERVRRHPERPFAVLYLDLDRFKVINDSMGHDSGDRVLQALGTRLARGLRASDTLARLGGDEFAFLLEEVEGLGDATRAAARLLREVARPLTVEGQEVFVSGSIGIAMGGPAYTRAEELLRDADIAMYRAKGGGRGRHQVFDPSMHERAVELLRLENDLRRALTTGGMQLHYQPIFSLETGRPVAVEALARWPHEGRGLVSPDDFIALAEETGLILPLGQWSLREACRQLRRWRRARGADSLLLTVNLSARHFSHDTLPTEVATALAEAGLDGSALALEITERSIIEDTARASAVVGALKKLGVRLYIDDFGTGYSSLSSLHRFPIDGLKIDRSFVAGLGAGGDADEIVRTVLLLARSLGMEAIAEGVETSQQLVRLRELGCRLAQGHLLARPLPAEAIEELLLS